MLLSLCMLLHKAISRPSCSYYLCQSLTFNPSIVCLISFLFNLGSLDLFISPSTSLRTPLNCKPLNLTTKKMSVLYLGKSRSYSHSFHRPCHCMVRHTYMCHFLEARRNTCPVCHRATEFHQDKL